MASGFPTGKDIKPACAAKEATSTVATSDIATRGIIRILHELKVKIENSVPRVIFAISPSFFRVNQ